MLGSGWMSSPRKGPGGHDCMTCRPLTRLSMRAPGAGQHPCAPECRHNLAAASQHLRPHAGTVTPAAEHLTTAQLQGRTHRVGEARFCQPQPVPWQSTWWRAGLVLDPPRGCQGSRGAGNFPQDLSAEAAGRWDVPGPACRKTRKRCGRVSGPGRQTARRRAAGSAPGEAWSGGGSLLREAAGRQTPCQVSHIQHATL